VSRPVPHVATEADATPRALSERIRQLQTEAQALAKEHVQALLTAMAETQAIAAEIAVGGPVYHQGSKELAGRVAEALTSQILTLQQIAERV
jgi:hypothetical protein